MLEDILNWVITNLTTLGILNYFLAFGILILCGFGLPVPEDITLVAAGLVSGFHATNPHIMLAICFIGVLLGDGTVYMIGKTMGYKIQKFKPFRKVLPPKRFAQVQKQFAKHGIWVLFFARFMPGLRSPIFLTAGMSHRIPLLHFLLMDGFAALISVPIWIYLGYYCADNIPTLVKYVKEGQHGVHVFIVIVLCIVAFFVAKSYIKKKIHQKRELLEKEKEEKQEKLTTTKAPLNDTDSKTEKEATVVTKDNIEE